MLAWACGRVKIHYYYGAFGLDAAGLRLSALDELYQSWFVVQNVLFFLLLWWVALKVRRVWIATVAALYSLIPIAAHYAFAFSGAGWADVLIRYRHTLLKLVPFAVALLALLTAGSRRVELLSPRWPHARSGLAVLWIVTASWAISSAKHMGSFDAQSALREPARYLARVDSHGGAAAELYLLHASPDFLAVWERDGFGYGDDTPLRVRLVPRRGEPLELRRRPALQPGGRYF